MRNLNNKVNQLDFRKTMDFSKSFEARFQGRKNYTEVDVDLNAKLQNTRHALQEAISENAQLYELIDQLYNEARVENVATSELLAEIQSPLFRNIPLPRNADALPRSEKAGYALYQMKFLGYAARKATEEYHIVKEHLEDTHKVIRKNVTDDKIKRTGGIKVPDLDGEKELKRGDQKSQLASPPVTPPDGGKKGKK